MWDSIGKAWQAAFELAWEAFVNGSLPIGAVIVNESGEIISSGRNRIFEPGIGNRKIAHAETEALYKLDSSKYPDKTYTLYTTLEPCPMCFCTVVMSNIRKLRVAARDGYCGAAYYSEKDPYIAYKKVETVFEYGELETVQLALSAYAELKLHDVIIKKTMDFLEKDNPAAIKIGKSLYAERRLDWHADNKTPFGSVYNEIALHK
ncbi:MAG: nucleoside deaminase [Defluviitaleaceae bacterium]|nr:nucleoside deaminase [Defluviitaleaceae bacterium]MCL2835674.1 nucleoside deaminase [Defluviitaleaceae bacterium]